MSNFKSLLNSLFHLLGAFSFLSFFILFITLPLMDNISSRRCACIWKCFFLFQAAYSLLPLQKPAM